MDALTQRATGVGTRETSTVTGNTVKQALTGGSSPVLRPRRGVLIANHDAAYRLLVKLTNSGESAPSISITDYDYSVPPYATLSLEVAESIAVHLLNSTGAATATAYTALEVAG